VRRGRTFVGLAMFLLMASACTSHSAGGSPPRSAPQVISTPASPSASSAPTGAAAGLPSFSRVVLIVMENREYGEVIGNSDAPYINRLAWKYALSTRFYATGHPSLANYLAILGGSTFGVSGNCTDCVVEGTSLVDQLDANGVPWKAYMEGMPSPCFTGAARGRYVKRHNPFMYFSRIASDPARCSRVVPLDRLSTDLDRGRLPPFVWITPDMCHDAHDCSIRTADHFLERWVPRLLAQLGSTGALFLTWDEGTTDAGCCSKASGGHIATVVAGSAVRRGARSDVPYDHYSILRTIEESWGLELLGAAACPCTRSMWDLVRDT
jgi:phosphatidylinositol-3-phosphatase